jgi:Glycosyltransferases involved in cell wall biogenesis
MSPKVSIVIPIYNMEPFLRPCLDSVVNQTMRDIQIICVNDGSTDGSLQILEQYAREDERILVIDKKNEGQGIARNVACEHVCGKYTLFVDADDWIEPELCHKAYYRAEADQSEMVFFLREKNGRVEGPCYFDKLQLIDPDRQERIFLLENIKNGPVAKLYRTDFLRSHAIYFTHHRRCEDISVHWLCCLAGKRYTIHPEVLYHVRVVDVEPGCGKWEKVQDVVNAYQAIKTELRERGFYKNYREVFLKDYFKSVHVACKKIIKNEQPLFIHEFLDTLSLEDIAFLREYRFPSSGTRLFYREIIDLFVDKKTFSKAVYLNRINRVVRSVVSPFEKFLRKTKMKKKAKRSVVNGADDHKRQFQGVNDLLCRLSEAIVQHREKDKAGEPSNNCEHFVAEKNRWAS